MKYTKLILIVILSVTALVFLSNINEQTFAFTNNYHQDNRIKLLIEPVRESVLLGEIVSLRFKFINNSDSEVGIQNCLVPEDGNIQILISRDDKNYLEYSHSKWGTADSKRVYVALKPNQTAETSTHILWNFVPNVANREELLKTNLGTNYVFQTKGVYSIKARCSVYSAKEVITAESKPIKIQVTKPVGEDLEVWNKIKDDGEIAYFIQEGDIRIPDYTSEKKVKIQREAEQLSSQYPNSRLAGQLKQSLEKFNKIEVERQNYLKRIKRQKQSE